MTERRKGKAVEDPAGLVVELVEQALGRGPNAIQDFTSEKKVDKYLAKPKRKKIEVCWIGGEMEDPLFQFWKLKIGGCFADKAHVIFTGVSDSCLWRDLSVYEGVRFGNVYLLVYDSTTDAGIKPSQRGLIFNG